MDDSGIREMEESRQGFMSLKLYVLWHLEQKWRKVKFGAEVGMSGIIRMMC